MWASITEQSGPFQEQSDSRIEEEGEYQMVYLTCVFEKETINMRVVHNQDGQIAGLAILPASLRNRPTKSRTASQRSNNTVGNGTWALPVP